MELIVSLAILVLITSPILGLFVMGTRISATSHRMTIAIFTAQLYVEQLVGLRVYDEVDELSIMLTTGNERLSYNGFWITAEKTDDPAPNLVEITVTVFDSESGGNVLSTQTNIINVAPSGI